MALALADGPLTASADQGERDDVLTTPVFRLQVVLETTAQEDDETDDDVWVSFRPDPGAGREIPDRLLLDSPRDDFERSTLHAFEVSPSTWGIGTMRDIRTVAVGLSGTDGWCFGSLAIVVNGEIRIPVSAGRICLDNESGGDPFGSVARGLSGFPTARAVFPVQMDRRRFTRGVLSPFGAPGSVPSETFRKWRDTLAGNVRLVLGAKQVHDRVATAVASGSSPTAA
jgi:hypothetical protein